MSARYEILEFAQAFLETDARSEFYEITKPHSFCLDDLCPNPFGRLPYLEISEALDILVAEGALIPYAILICPICGGTAYIYDNFANETGAYCGDCPLCRKPITPEAFGIQLRIFYEISPRAVLPPDWPPPEGRLRNSLLAMRSIADLMVLR